MKRINRIVLAALLILCFNNQAQNIRVSEGSGFWGDWKVEKIIWGGLGRHTKVEIDKLEQSILHINSDMIYFDNIMFLGTCKFMQSSIVYSKLFDKGNPEYYWFEDGKELLLRIKDTGPLPHMYSKEILAQIKVADFGCENELSRVYLKQDTLILNYISGVTLFMTRTLDSSKE